MSQSKQSLEPIFETQVQTLSLTLQPSTVRNYRSVSHRFLGYLRGAFPKVRRLSQLRRDPHMLGWFRWLCDQDPPLSNSTREEHLLCLRRLLMIWPSKVIPFRPVSLSVKIFLFVPSISLGLCLRKMINDFKRNCAAPTTCMRMLSC